MQDNDNDLMLLILQQDQMAFQRLVSRWQNRLVSYFFRHLGEQTIAEDLSQEVFINIWKAKRYIPGSFSKWIYKLAHNKLMDHYRRKGVATSEWDDALNQIPHAENLEAQMLKNEEQQQVQQAIQALPQQQKKILILSKYQDLNHETIAEVLGCSKKSVKVLLFRSVQRLSRIFKEMYPYEIK